MHCTACLAVPLPSSVLFEPTCDGVLTAAALLGHTVLVAVDTENLVLVFGEAGPCQSLGAGAAHKAVAVPRLLLVVHPSRGYRLQNQQELHVSN